MKNINKQKLIFLTVLFTFIITLSITYAKSMGFDIKNSVLRLHIVANSDSAADQELKLKIRDRILKDTKDLFSDCQSSSSAIRVAEENIHYLEAIANDEIQKCGKNYTANVFVGEAAFPTKTYGNICLPSGKYNALKIEIGDAKGKNWWCVMYPPLCFADGILITTSAGEQKLKETLSEDEYALITKTNDGSIPVEIKFKLVEVIQNIF